MHRNTPTASPVKAVERRGKQNESMLSDAATDLTTVRWIRSNAFSLQLVSRDLNTFSRFARDVLIIPPNVKNLHTSFLLGEVKSAGALPLGHLKYA